MLLDVRHELLNRDITTEDEEGLLCVSEKLQVLARYNAAGLAYSREKRGDLLIDSIPTIEQLMFKPGSICDPLPPSDDGNQHSNSRGSDGGCSLNFHAGPNEQYLNFSGGSLT